MRRFRIIPAVIALLLGGCAVRGRQQAKATVVPPPPAPAPPPVVVEKPEPLSIPQTQMQLPPEKPVNPDALAAVQVPETPAETPPAAPRPTRRPTAPPRPEPAPTPAAATPAAEPELRAPVQEIVPAEEMRRLADSVASRNEETRKVLVQAQPRRLSKEQRGVMERIRSFLQQSDEAGKRGDWRQADALAERAQILARELPGGNR